MRLLRVLAPLALPLFLAGCGPVLIVGGIILGLGLNDDDDGCGIGGAMVNVSISGTVRFEKRLADPRTSEIRPVRGARVEVLRTNCSQEVLASTTTGEDGSYAVSVGTPSGSVLRVAVLAERDDPASAATVRNNSRELLIYSLESGDLHLTASASQSLTQDLLAGIDCRFALAGAFNILEVTRTGFEAIDRSFLAQPHSLTVFWALGSPDGTFFSIAPQDLDGDGVGDDPFIQLRGGDASDGFHNTDHFDDGLILHEFGHFVAFSYSRDDSPGGIHFAGELLDPRLAWSEGWADFFSGASRESPTILDTSEMPLGCPISFRIAALNLESKDLTCGPAVCCSGIWSEEAVGALLWDIFDGGAEVGDAAQVPLADILRALVALKSHRFVYVGDFFDEIRGIAPGQSTAIEALAAAQGMTDAGGAAIPFPDPFPNETRSDSQLAASAAGSVDGCGGACFGDAQNFKDSSRFFEVQLPPQGQSLTAHLGISGAPATCCDDNLELRIYNDSQTLFFSSEGQSGPARDLSFPLDSDFSPGSFVLVEVAGDVETCAEQGTGQRGSFVLNVNVP